MIAKFILNSFLGRRLLEPRVHSGPPQIRTVRDCFVERQLLFKSSWGGQRFEGSGVKLDVQVPQVPIASSDGDDQTDAALRTSCTTNELHLQAPVTVMEALPSHS